MPHSSSECSSGGGKIDGQFSVVRSVLRHAYALAYDDVRRNFCFSRHVRFVDFVRWAVFTPWPFDRRLRIADFVMAWWSIRFMPARGSMDTRPRAKEALREAAARRRRESLRTKP
jgi:hypothetical protein